MLVKFRTRQLERRFERSKEAERAWGAVVGRKYVQRILLLQSAETLGDLMSARSLRCHPLKGKRAGTYGVNLTGSMRLIVRFENTDESVVVTEVTDYHDD